MNFVVIISALLVAVLAKEVNSISPEQVLQALRKCQNNPETFVAEEVLRNLDRGRFQKDGNLPKHIICMFREMRFLKEDGKINIENLKAFINGKFNDKARAEQIFGICAVDKENEEETALNLSKCLYKVL